MTCEEASAHYRELTHAPAAYYPTLSVTLGHNSRLGYAQKMRVRSCAYWWEGDTLVIYVANAE